MSFLDWLYSSYPNPKVDGAWGILHITVLAACILFIVASSLLLKNKSERLKYYILFSLAMLIVAFGVTRRIVGFINAPEYTFNRIMKILLPRPGCAISCWLVILAVIIRKKFFYNFASIIGILCAVIFFAYPSVGFTNEFILFENLYSIMTHSLFLVMSVCFITYKFTDFRYKLAKKEGICFAIMMAYVFIEIYLLKIDPDPFFFLPGNEVQDILGMGYGLYLPLYILFMAVYFSAFYLIKYLKQRKK